MIELLMGEADSLRVEVPGDAGAGAEFRVRVGSTFRWTQSKRQRSNGAWTLAALLKEGFLQQWLPKLRAGDTCIFSSTTSADELRQLCASAQDAIDLAEFEKEFLGSGRRKKFEALKRAWNVVDSDEAYRLLGLVRVDTIDGNRLDQYIETSLHLLVEGNLQVARRVLLQYADEIVHHEVSADDVWDLLAENGIRRKVHTSSVASPAASVSGDRWLADRLDRLPAPIHNRIVAAMAADDRAARRLIRLVTDDQVPQSVLELWTLQRPTWLTGADWDTQIAAAELAGAYGVPRLQADLFTELAEQGCPPEQLWRARAVLALDAAGDKAARAAQIESLLPSGTSSHPFAGAVAAVFASHPSEALSHLQQWTPEDPADRAAKARLLIQIELGHPDQVPTDVTLERALAESQSLLADEWLGSVALWRARALTMRARLRGSKIPFRDLREAQEGALRVRDDRRQCRADSAEAAAASFEAAAVRGDTDFVLRNGLPEELGGTATIEEFQHSDVAFHVAAAAMQQQRFELAQVAAANVTDAFQRKLLEALRAEVQGETSSAIWREAVNLAADNDEHLVQALNGLARTGATDLPRLDHVRRLSPQTAEEIQAIAEIRSGNLDRSTATLRTRRRESLLAAMALAEAYRSTGQTESATETLMDAAEDFSDPSLKLQAATIYAQSGRTDKAKEVISALVIDRDRDWPEFIEVLKFAAQLALDEPDLELATKYAKRILHENPRDEATRWIMINCLMVLDQMDYAWEVLEAAPTPLEPEDRTRAQMWVELHRRSADPVTTMRACLDVLRRFRDDEEFNAFALTSIMLRQQADTAIPADLLSDYHYGLERFFDRWPDSTYLSRIRTSNDELLIQALTDSLRPTPERLAERHRLNREFQRGEKPLVLLAEYANKTYSEVLVRRGCGVLPTVHPDPRELALCRQTVLYSANHDVALDTSAVVVLSALPRHIRDRAMAIFRRGLTSEEVARDARQYREDLNRTSGTLYYNPDTDGPGYAEMTEDEAANVEATLSTAQAMIEQLRREPIQPRPHGRRVRLNVYASVIQTAASKQIAVWCDDAAARLMMREHGIASFSTHAVLEHLLGEGNLAVTEYQTVLDTLVRARIGAGRPELARLLRVAREQNWQPNSVAACLAQPQTWTDTAHTSTLFNDLLRTCHRENPSQTTAFFQAAVFGAVTNCPNTRAGVEIGALLLAGSVLALTADGVLAREMVDATRTAVTSALPVDNPAGVTTDPLPAAAKDLRALLLESSVINADQVFPFILKAFRGLNDKDIRTVTEALLSDDQ
ncbi:hypothetical protein [Actinoplanes sp. NBRC 103695]|uniref:tetratricopeptide repeat protein n=1 Tax=Actinoplanes sp. NBRC 103695 TaxID=3032202 RepID=UPI002552B202|nr:hypothetical protein [Actinoplanes sp. NBRC 103695]